MTEEEFLLKWGDYVQAVDLGGQAPPPPRPALRRRRLLQASNPFAMLLQAIQSITSAWQSIVNAFKSSYSEQLLESHLQNGWAKYKQGTRVFKGAGLHYDKMDEFFADIQKMIAVPDKYKQDFNDQIKWIQFFDNTTWSEHDTQFSKGSGGTDTIFTMYARNREADGEVDLLFLKCDQTFKLAKDYFVISESKSILGGLFSSTKIKFKTKKAALTDKDLMFVSSYFSLLAYQQIALAEGLPAPPDPNLGPDLAALALVM